MVGRVTARAGVALDPLDPDLARQIAAATDGHLLDVAFDAVGLRATFEQALAQLGPGGRLVGWG